MDNLINRINSFKDRLESFQLELLPYFDELNQYSLEKSNFKNYLVKLYKDTISKYSEETSNNDEINNVLKEIDLACSNLDNNSNEVRRLITEGNKILESNNNTKDVIESIQKISNKLKRIIKNKTKTERQFEIPIRKAFNRRDYAQQNIYLIQKTNKNITVMNSLSKLKNYRREVIIKGSLVSLNQETNFIELINSIFMKINTNEIKTKILRNKHEIKLLLKGIISNSRRKVKYIINLINELPFIDVAMEISIN